MHRCIDGFVAKIGSESQERPNGVNMVEWFDMSSFDLFGEMAFGESFGCVASGKFSYACTISSLLIRILARINNLTH